MNRVPKPPPVPARVSATPGGPVASEEVDSDLTWKLVLAVALCLFVVFLLLLLAFLKTGNGVGVSSQSEELGQIADSESVETEARPTAIPQADPPASESNPLELESREDAAQENIDAVAGGEDSEQSVEGDVGQSSSDQPDNTSVKGGFESPFSRVKFFGVEARGDYILFVIDSSSSMAPGRLSRAKEELLTALADTRPGQHWGVVFFNDSALVADEFLHCEGGGQDRQRVAAWINRISASGGTDPLPAVDVALKQGPDAILLLSDGEFDPFTASTIVSKAQGKTKIHCISIDTDAFSLRDIATKTGGSYRAVPL